MSNVVIIIIVKLKQVIYLKVLYFMINFSYQKDFFDFFILKIGIDRREGRDLPYLELI